MSTATAPAPVAHAPPRASLPTLLERESLRRRRRIAFWIGLALAVPLLAVAGYAVLKPKPLPFETRFRTEVVSRGELVREVRATGHLEAESTVEVGAEISGKIASVETDFNRRVTKGQILARFDRAALEAQVAQTDAALATARAAREQANVDRAQAKVNLTRSDELFAKGIESPAEHDASRTAAALAEARLAAADSQVAAAAAAQSLAHTNLSHSLVRSPIDGIVISRNVDPGQTVVSALQSAVLFVVAADLSRMRVLAAVDEADVAEVRAGQPVEFGVNAFPERTFQGVVKEVRTAPVLVQEVVTYTTEITVENADLALRPGMTASVRIRTGSVADTLRVANGALHFDAPGEPKAGSPGVWLLEKGRLRRVPLEPGLSDGELTAVKGPVDPGAVAVVDLTAEGKKVYGHERH